MITFVNRQDMIRACVPANSEGAEVGVFEGGFSADILELTQVGKLHLVDCWAHQSDGYELDSCNRANHEQDVIYRKVCERFAPEIAKGRVVMHRMLSIPAAATFATDTLDWVYIDANHAYEAVLGDLWTWCRVVKGDGCIMGHDYADGPEERKLHFGVVRAVTDFCNQSGWKLVGLSQDAPPSFYLKRP